MTILSISLFAMRVDGAPLSIVKDGKPNAQIVVSDEADRLAFLKEHSPWHIDSENTTQEAAVLLQTYVEKASGAKLPIVKASEASKDGAKILVGRSALTTHLEDRRKALAPEGYLLLREENKIYILGEVAPETKDRLFSGLDRGTRFGVLDFLDREVGVRFYMRGELGEVIPNRSDIVINELNDTQAPHYRMRVEGMGRNLDSRGSRRGNSTGFWVNHTFDLWRSLSKEHPEVFGVNEMGERLLKPEGGGGHKYNRICFSEPKTFEIQMAHFEDFQNQTGPRHWESEVIPNDTYFRIGVPDVENIYHCRCERCIAQHTRERKDALLSNLLFGYFNKVATEVDKRWPGKRLAVFSYTAHQWPPVNMPAAPNLDILLCTCKGNALLVEPAHWAYNADMVDAWHEYLGKDRSRLYLWEYFVYPRPTVPMLYPHTMQRWMQRNRDKVAGFFNNIYNEKYPRENRLTMLNTYFWHKLLWNPDADVDRLLQTFCTDLFGPAAEEMQKLFQDCIATWEGAEHSSWTGGGSAYISEKDKYGKIYQPDAIKRMKNTLAKAQKKAPKGSLYEKRIAWFEEAFIPFFADADTFHRTSLKTFVAPVPKLGGGIPPLSSIADDAAWKKAPPLNLVNWKSGAPVAEGTIVRVARDGTHLVVQARMNHSEDAQPVAKGSKHDDPTLLSDELFGIDFDLRRTNALEFASYYRIQVNANGQISDGISFIPAEVDGLHRSAWVGEWDAKETEVVVDKGKGFWAVEMRIPFSAFRELEDRLPPELRVQFWRAGKTRAAGWSAWSPMFGEVSEDYSFERMGKLNLN